MGAAAAGFLSHWIVPAAVKEAPAATVQAASFAPQETTAEKRLLAVELKLEEIARQVNEIGKGMSAVKCRLNIENTCPPEAK